MQGSLKLSEKQFAKLALFRNVKNINGERVYKSLCLNSRLVSYELRSADKQLSTKQNFIYVKEGQIFVYKIQSKFKNTNAVILNSNNSTIGSVNRSLIKSYRVGQYCGFQDYPLFWGEEFFVEVSPGSVLILVPLSMFYKLFRRVIPMTYLQSKAEYLKRLALFKGVQLQKIFKLACLSQKFRIQKQMVFIRQGDKIENIIIICSGKIQLTSSAISETIICGQNEDFLIKQVKQNIPVSLFNAKCIQEADVLSIPKQEYKKIVDIRYKLKQTFRKQTLVRQGTLEAEDIQKSLEFSTGQLKKTNYHTIYGKSMHQKLQPQRNDRSRAKSAQRPRIVSGDRDRNRQKSLATEGSQDLGVKEANFSLGQIQLLKFIRRKQRVESRNFFRYIQSRAPQIVLNPSKQFALVKPLYKSSSQYVRNMKRKIKHSMTTNTTAPICNNFLL